MLTLLYKECIILHHLVFFLAYVSVHDDDMVYGQDAVLRCELVSTAFPVMMTSWYRNAAKLEDGDRYSMDDRNQTLTIHHAGQ